MHEQERRTRRDTTPTTRPARPVGPAPGGHVPGVLPGGPVPDALGGALADAVSLRAAPDLLMREPLLLTDRPWEEIEAEQRRRARRPFEEDEEPLFPLPDLPIMLDLPEQAGPLLLLTDRTWAEIELDREVERRGAPLLLTDRPWEQIEAEQRRRARRPFEDDQEPLFPLPKLPITIELPGPPLLLTERPWEQIETERREKTEAEAAAAAALRDAKASLRPVWLAFQRLAKQMKALDVTPAEFKRLQAAADAAGRNAVAAPTPESVAAAEIAATAAVDWVAAERRRAVKKAYEEKNTNARMVERFVGRVEALAAIVGAVRGSLTKSTNHKRPAVDKLAVAVRALEDDVRKGYSRADEAQLVLLTAQVHEEAKGVTIKQEFLAQAKVLASDPDDDARTGNEPALTYRGHRYDKVPGFASPPLYARIDNAVLRLVDEPLEAYTDAMLIGKIPANEMGASGVKQKALHWEIKLIAKTAKRLMGDSDLRLRNDQREQNGKLQKTSKGVEIRYLVFDERYNAH